MAINANASNQIAALKELYDNPTEYLQDAVYPTNPFLALVRKDESPSGMGGKYLPVPVIYGNPQGRSADFATAQSNQTATADISFFVYRVKNYQLVTIENELLEATRDDIAAFIDQSKLQVDTALSNLSNELGRQLFGNATGSRGMIAAGTITSGAITLRESADIVNFEIGMALVSYSVSSLTPTQSTGAAVGYVISINRGAGTLVVSATQGGAAGTPTNWSGTNFPYLAVQGDINFTSNGLATGAARQLCGLGMWVPDTAPAGSENFWGVDRSIDATRLAGLRYDGSSEMIEEALVNAAALTAREAGKSGKVPSMCFMSFASFAALENALGSKVQYVQVRHAEAEIAFDAIRINAPYGQINVIPDRNCPAKRAYLLSMDTWKLRTLGPAPHILKYGMEGLEGLRVGNQDALEVRMGYYGNLVCSLPGANCVVTLSS